MKILILALTTLSFSAPAFAGENGFICESHWYRDARLSVSSDTISLKDSYVRGFPQVAKMVEEKMRLEKGNYLVNTVGLTIHRDGGLACTTSGLLVDCRGRTKRAWLEVKGWLSGEGVSGELNLTFPVELKGLRLKTNLGGNDLTAVRLNYLNLAARAKVVVNGEEVDLGWETFFNSRDDHKSGSFCTKH